MVTSEQSRDRMIERRKFLTALGGITAGAAMVPSVAFAQCDNFRVTQQQLDLTELQLSTDEVRAAFQMAVSGLNIPPDVTTSIFAAFDESLSGADALDLCAVLTGLGDLQTVLNQSGLGLAVVGAVFGLANGLLCLLFCPLFPPPPPPFTFCFNVAWVVAGFFPPRIVCINVCF